LFHPHGWRVRPLEKTKNKKHHPRETFVSSQKKSIIAAFLRPKKKKEKRKKREEPGKSIDYTPKVREKAQSNGKKGRAIWAPQK
jgi:cytochrome oxidase assembly protein ShyY1